MRIARFLLGAVICSVAATETSNAALPWLAPVAASDAVVVSEADNGRTIEVERGARIELVLHSTYWQDFVSSDPKIVAPEGGPRAEANLKACMPGAGCGTITQVFAAVETGEAKLTAGRKVCGEALPCPPDQQHFSLTIVIQRRG